MKAGTVYEVTLNGISGHHSSIHRLAEADPNPVMYLVKQACRRQFGERIQVLHAYPYDHAVSVYRGDECVAEALHFEILKA